jgi:biotin operon repressor
MPKTKLGQSSQWVSPAELSDRLGISTSTIKRRRNDGVFRLGTHYRLTGSPKALRPAYLYHVRKCSDILGIPIEDP